MSLEISQVTHCQYLFGKQSYEVFKDSSFPEQLINHSLEIMMRVHVFMLSVKDTFDFIDPDTHTNLCHLYALRAAAIKRSYQSRSNEQKLLHTEENRFLHLSFFLSFTFISDKKPLYALVNKTAQELKIKLPHPEKKFRLIVLDSQGEIGRAARIALNDVYRIYLQSILKEGSTFSPLYQELFQLSITASDVCKETFYTYPKLAGVIYLVDAFAREKIAFMLKVKIVTKEGNGVLSYVSLDGQLKLVPKEQLQKNVISIDDPVVIFESYATDGSLSVENYKNLSTRCPNNFFRHPSSKNRHLSTEKCLLCTSEKRRNLSAFQENIEKAIASPKNLFYALGADFVQERQSDFLSFFHNPKDFPHLTKIFETALPTIASLGVSMKNPATFSVFHVHVDNLKRALIDQLHADESPEQMLKSRGLL